MAETTVAEPPSDPGEQVPRPASPLSRRSRVLLATAAAALAVATAVHLTVMFLGATPTNTVSRRFEPRTKAWTMPWLEQNWSLFAPNPPAPAQIAARARTGSGTVGPWIDLSAANYREKVRHDPWPSREAQYQMFRAWIGYAPYQLTTGGENTESVRQQTSRLYLRNIALSRLKGRVPGPVTAVQVRATIAPPPPPSGYRPPAAITGVVPPSAEPVTTTLGWWDVPAGTRVS